MEFPLVVINAVIRSRNRSSYFQACIVLLLVVVLVTVLIISTTPVSVTERIGNERIAVSRTIEDISECVAPTFRVPLSQVEVSPTTQHPVPTIFAITHTRRRLTQLLDLTSLCQTLMNVHHLIWIVVEGSTRQSPLVKALLSDCKVQTVHLTVPRHMLPSGGSNSNGDDSKYGVYALRRGAREKNVGLQWIREHCEENCTGVVYFMDDESKYDTRLFEMMRQIIYVGVWPVAFAGQIKFEGPVCVNGSAVEWHTLHPGKPFPISSLGFALNTKCLLDEPEATFGFAPHSRTKSLSGLEESDFLSNFLESNLDARLECRGSDREVYVWQVKSKIDPYLAKRTYHGKYKLKT